MRDGYSMRWKQHSKSSGVSSVPVHHRNARKPDPKINPRTESPPEIVLEAMRRLTFIRTAK